jgi:hypothetical protein
MSEPGHPPYLASLAQKHGMQLATLDEGIKHKATFVIPA